MILGTFTDMNELTEALQAMASVYSPRENQPARKTGAPPPPRSPLAPAFLARGREALKELSAATPDAGPDERILYQLVADEVAIAAALLDLQAQLAARLGLLLDRPREMAAISKVLREVVAVSNAITRRVEGALGVASNIRAQRRFFEKHNVRRNTRG